MLRKPVICSASRIFNEKSGFGKKNRCSGLTFSAGTSCAFSCTYCYVDSMVGRRRYVRRALAGTGLGLREVVIRRSDPVSKLKRALGARFEGKEWSRKTVYASPLVDVAATTELARETVELCRVILDQSDLQIRLLSKSPLLKTHVADPLGRDPAYCRSARHRIIFGLSTGTLDDRVARAVEPNAPSVSRRLKALRQLQEEGWRTFGMLCPILPQDPEQYVRRVKEQIDLHRCEHVWAEVLNARADSTHLTIEALQKGGLSDWADALAAASGKGSREAWERYALEMFDFLSAAVPMRPAEGGDGGGARLQFLQYVTRDSEKAWKPRVSRGAVLL